MLSCPFGGRFVGLSTGLVKCLMRFLIKKYGLRKMSYGCIADSHLKCHFWGIYQAPIYATHGLFWGCYGDLIYGETLFNTWYAPWVHTNSAGPRGLLLNFWPKIIHYICQFKAQKKFFSPYFLVVLLFIVPLCIHHAHDGLPTLKTHFLMSF